LFNIIKFTILLESFVFERCFCKTVETAAGKKQIGLWTPAMIQSAEILAVYFFWLAIGIFYLICY
jgi:hypothetical protein